MIRIYGSNASRATRNLWVLEELGLPYEQIKSTTADGAKKPEFLAVNPSGKVPAITDGDMAMSESLAINVYLAETYGAGKLWPADAAGVAKCLQWTLWAATELEPHVVGMLIEGMFKPEADRNPAAYKASAEKLAPALKVLDAALKDKTTLAGDSFSVADLNVACVSIGLTRLKHDLSPYPNVDRWLRACLSRPAQQRVAAMPRP